MTARRLISVLALVAALFAVHSGSAVAHPGRPDTRPCVSIAEYHSMHEPMARRALERRWEVVGLGAHGPTPNAARYYERFYPACGFPGGQFSYTCYVGVMYSVASDRALDIFRPKAGGVGPAIGPHRLG